MLQTSDPNDAYVCGLFDADANLLAWGGANGLMREYLLSHIHDNIVMPRSAVVHAEMKAIAEELLIPKPVPIPPTKGNPQPRLSANRKRKNTEQNRMAETEQKERVWDVIQEQATPNSVLDYCSVKWVDTIVPSRTGDYRDTLAKCFGICIQKFGVASKLMMDQITQVYRAPPEQRKNHTVLSAISPIEFWIMSAAMGKASLILYSSESLRIFKRSRTNAEANSAIIDLASCSKTIPLYTKHEPIYPNRWGAYKFFVEVLKPTTHESVYEHILKIAEYTTKCSSLDESHFRHLESAESTSAFSVSWKQLCKASKLWGHANSEIVWSLLLKSVCMYKQLLASALPPPVENKPDDP